MHKDAKPGSSPRSTAVGTIVRVVIVAVIEVIVPLFRLTLVGFNDSWLNEHIVTLMRMRKNTTKHTIKKSIMARVHSSIEVSFFLCVLICKCIVRSWL